jgi:hypothetical protein
MKIEKTGGGGESDVFQVQEDGTWRTLNTINSLSTGDVIKARQSQHEFDPIERQSNEVQIIVL